MNQALSQSERDARTWAAVCHLAAFAAFIIPLGHIIGPLVIWLVKRHDSPFVDEQGREALNFQITITLFFLGLLVFMFLASLLLLPFIDRQPGIALTYLPLIALFPILGLADFILILVATVRASNGESYQYPMNLRIVR